MCSQEKHDKIITLHDISYEGLSAVINFIYTLQINLTDETVANILEAASLLQIHNVIRRCERHMIYNMRCSTWEQFRTLGDKYSCSHVVAKAHLYFLEHFHGISNTQDFLRISKDDLIKYLTNDSLNYKGTEADIAHAVLEWMKADSDRGQHTEEVMSHVRFMLIDSSTLFRLLDAVFGEPDVGIQKLIKNALQYHLDIYKQPLVSCEQNQPRGKKTFLTLHGGTARSGLNTFENVERETRIYFVTTLHNYQGDFTNPYTSYPDVYVVGSLAAVQLNNFLFIFATDNRSWSPISQRYNASTGQWLDLKPVPRQATVKSAVAICGVKIYLFGGMFVTRHTQDDATGPCTRFAYRYDIASNKWERITDLPQPLASMASCTLGHVVYISGGMNSHEEGIDKLYGFDTRARVYGTLPPMSHGRMEHCMEGIEEKLFVVGGSNDIQQIQEIEIYDIQSRQWSTISDTLRVDSASSLIDGNTIYITGGLMNGMPSARITHLDTESQTLNMLNSYRFILPAKTAYHFCGYFITPQGCDY